MKVLLTGAFGNVGQSVLIALQTRAFRERGFHVAVFEYPTPRNRAISRKLGKDVELIWGDIRNRAAVQSAVEGRDYVIHLAALIPPAADFAPERAASINIGGTKAVIDACAHASTKPRLVHASSIAVYGDRLKEPFIRVSDRLCPSDGDVYGAQKVEAEGLVRSSGLDWSILRLSYIVWRKKLAMDPLMFRMPLATSVEVCHTLDTGVAFANAIGNGEVIGKTFNIGGGQSCRTSYRDYINEMMTIFGLGGSGFLPDDAFAKHGYHCGFLDTEESQRILKFQGRSIADYYHEVGEEARALKPFTRMFKSLIQRSILRKSLYLGGNGPVPAPS